jgi:plastocyanin
MRPPILIPIASLIAGLFVLVLSHGGGEAADATIDTGNLYYCAPSFENGVCDTTITAGDTVTWQNSAGLHTVTQCDAPFTTCPPAGGFDSGLIATGASFARQFDTPGTFPYNCAFHPTQMRGRVIVAAQQTATAAPPPTSPGDSGAATQTPRLTVVNNIAPPTPTVAGVPRSGGPVEAGGGSPWITAILGAAFSAAGGVSVYLMMRRHA